MTVGDLKLLELTSQLMLMKDSKMREVTFTFEDGLLRTKILYKKGRKILRFRTKLDIEEFENMEIKEFYTYLAKQCEKYGEDRYKKK